MENILIDGKLIKDPLVNSDFLLALDKIKEKEIYARITVLSWQENPIEYIEGRITGGSINIDGASVIRRSCSLTLVATDLNINDFYWGLKSKFKLEIGVKNKIDKNYPDIIWFPQGLYVFTSFSTSLNATSYTISLSGKDKMCLLNGDIDGALPHTIDFGTVSEYDKETNFTTITPIPIKEIIRYCVSVYGNEPLHNIIINDVDDYGVELLEYRGDSPIYFFKNDMGYINMTMNKNMPCYVFEKNDWIQTFIGNDEKIVYDNLNEIIELSASYKTGTKIRLDKNNPESEFTLARIEYGQTAGYRLTELTYAGELIANPGESLTSVLDKIKNMLGNYEYFYDINGQFIFQKQKNYLYEQWNPLRENINSDNKNDLYVESAAYTSALAYAFHNSNFFTSISNQPQLNNIKNDFSIHGTRTSLLGDDINIRMRYALDYKPELYTNYDNTMTYLSNHIIWDQERLDKLPKNTEKLLVDWREVIYQMGQDYMQNNNKDNFYFTIQNNNLNLYPGGKTNYERYYTDLNSSWRDIYELPIQEENEPLKEYRYYIRKDMGYEECIFMKYDDSGNPTILDDKVGPSGQANIAKIKTPEDNVQYYYWNKNDKIWAEYENISKFLENNDYYIKSKNDRGEDVYLKINIYQFKDKENNKYYYYLNQNDIIPFEHWNKKVIHNPSLIDFWMDFLGEGSELEKYFISAIGSRSKVINDDKITGMYFKEVPSVIFITPEEWNAMGGQPIQTGYIYIRINSSLNGFFNISARGKSAHDVMEESLYQNTYAIDNITINTIPIYYLQPNTRISVQDFNSNIEGEYIISKLTIPLTYNGTMSITASRAVDTIY